LTIFRVRSASSERDVKGFSTACSES